MMMSLIQNCMTLFLLLQKDEPEYKTGLCIHKPCTGDAYTMNHLNHKSNAAGILGVAVLIFIDQYTKHLASVYLMNKNFVLIRYVFELEYLENTGAAWGILAGRHIFFVIVACAITVLLSFYYILLPAARRFRPLKIFFVLITAGALGNMIDRIAHGYVIDFFYFSLINFPIFNVADICVSIGAVLLVLFVLFYYKDNELDIFRLNRKK